jgi:hypothetical protein
MSSRIRETGILEVTLNSAVERRLSSAIDFFDKDMGDIVIHRLTAEESRKANSVLG